MSTHLNVHMQRGALCCIGGFFSQFQAPKAEEAKQAASSATDSAKSAAVGAAGKAASSAVVDAAPPAATSAEDKTMSAVNDFVNQFN